MPPPRADHTTLPPPSSPGSPSSPAPPPSPDSPSSSNPPSSAPPKPRRWRRWALRVALIAVILLIGLGFLATRPVVLTPLVQKLIAQSLAKPVALQAARLSWTGGLTLTGLTIAAAPETGHPLPADAATIAVAETIRLKWHWPSMSLETIELDRPQIWMTQDLDRGRWVFESTHEETEDPEPSNAPINAWPVIVVNNGRIHRQQIQNGQLQDLGDLALNGRIHPQVLPDAVRATSRVKITDTDEDIELTARIHPVDRRLQITLPSLTYGPQLNALLPADVAEIGRKTQLAGVIKQIQLEVFRQEDGRLNFDTRFEIADGELVVDYVQRQVPFRRVAGRFHITSHGLEFKDLTGQAGGIDYTINGWLGQGGLDAPLSISIRTQPFRLQQGTDIFPLPELPQVRAFYERLNATGDVRFSADITRENFGETPQLQGALDVINAQATTRWFPYPLNHIAGRLRFNNHEIVVDELRATSSNGGDMRVRGVLGPLNEQMDYDLRIDLINAPINETMAAALPDTAEPFIRDRIYQHVDRPTRIRAAHTRVTRVGGYHLPQQLTIHVDVHGLPFQQDGVPGPLQIQEGWVHIGQYGLSFSDVVAQVPGTDNPSPGTGDPLLGPAAPGVAAPGVAAPGPGGPPPGAGVARDAHARLSGRSVAPASTGSPVLDHALSNLVTCPQQHAYLIPPRAPRGWWQTTVFVNDIRLPITPTTRADFPPAMARTLNDLDLTGVFRGRALYQSQPLNHAQDPQRWPVQLTGRLHDGRVAPYGARQPVESLTADVRVDDRRVRIDHAAGRFLGDPVTAQIDYTQAIAGTQPAGLRIQAQQPRTTIDADWFAALPPRLGGIDQAQTVFRDQRLALTGQLDIAYQQPADVTPGVVAAVSPSASPPPLPSGLPPTGLDIVFKPSTASWSPDPQGQAPVVAEGIDGRVLLNGQDLTLQSLSGQLHGATVHLDGGVRAIATGDPVFDLTLSGRIDRWTPAVFALLPSTIAGSLQNFQVAGPVDIQHLHLQNATATRSLLAEGRLTLDACNLHFLFPITALTGDLTFRFDPSATHLYQAQIDGLSGRWADRPFADLQTRITSGAGEARQVLLTPITGTVCGGDLNAQAWINVGDQPLFGFDGSLTDAAWGLVLPANGPEQAQAASSAAPSAPAAPTAPSADEGRGVFSAQLSLTGPIDNAAGMRGQCRWRLNDVWVFNRPMLMSVLSVASLSLPQQQAFNRLQGRFGIDGPKAFIEEMAIIGPQVVLVGTGQANWQRQTVDLVFVPVNPNVAYIAGVTELVELIRGQIFQINARGSFFDVNTSITPVPSVWNIAQSIGDALLGTDAGQAPNRRQRDP